MTDAHAQPLAIDGGSPLRTAPWPHDRDPGLADDADPAAALAAELSPWLGGASCDRILASLEDAMRAAIEVALDGASGGEIALPDLFAAPWVDAVVSAGCAPVPVEVDPESGALSARGLARAVGEATRAVVIVHPFGHPANVTEIRRLLSARGLPVVEDASGALGAAERAAPAGTLGDISLVALGAPDDAAAPAALRGVPGDGAAAAPEADVARRALAWLRAEAERLPLRRGAAWEMTFGLRGMRGASGMYHGRWVRHAYSRYVVRLRSLLWKRPLAETVAALRAEGIPCEPAADAPLHARDRVRARLGGDSRLDPDHFPAAERLPSEWLAVPLSATMTQRDVDDLVAALRRLEAAWA